MHDLDNLGISFSVFIDDDIGAVGGTALHHDYLQVAIGLIDQRVQALPDIWCCVKSDDYD